MQRTPPRHLNNDINQKQLLQHVHKENIRRYLLKGSISKKANEAGNECEFDYGDTDISSDENSDCCSEPTNDSDDISYHRDLERYNSKKRFRIGNTEGKQPSKISPNKENEGQNLEFSKSVQQKGNLGGSLQNVYEPWVILNIDYGQRTYILIKLLLQICSIYIY